MKKLILLALIALAIPTQSQAAVACLGGIYCLGSAPVAGYGGPAFLPFTTALGFGLAVEYLNAEGVAFPLCQDDWMHKQESGKTKCWNEYPEAVHHDGV